MLRYFRQLPIFPSLIIDPDAPLFLCLNESSSIKGDGNDNKWRGNKG